MKFLTANGACGKLSTSRDPCRTAPIRPEFKLVIYEFAWPIYEFELGNSDFRAVWNALVHSWPGFVHVGNLVTIGVYRNDLDWLTKKHRKTFKNEKLISIRLLTEINEKYIGPYKYSSPKSFSQFQCSQRLSVHQHPMSFVLNVVLLRSRISSNNVLLSDL